MAELGGYFAVSYLAESIVRDAWDAAWDLAWERAHGHTRHTIETPFGRLIADGPFGIDKPALTLRPQSNDLAVRLSAHGRFAVTLGGASAGSVFVTLETEIGCPIRVTRDFEGSFSETKVDLTQLSFEGGELRLTWYEGPLHPHVQDALLSPAFRAELTELVRKKAAPYLTIILPTDKVALAELALMTQGVPQSVIFTPMVKLGDIKILEGWLAVGIDATSGIAPTTGTAALIGPPPDVPPLASSSLPQWEDVPATARVIVDVNALMPFLRQNAAFALQFAASQRPKFDPNVDSVAISVGGGGVTVKCSGRYHAPDPFPAVDFSATLALRPFIPKNTHALYATVKPKVDADVPLHMTVIAAIFDFFTGDDTFAALRRVNKSDMAILGPVKFGGAVPDVPGLRGSVVGWRLSVENDFVGLFGTASVSASPNAPDFDIVPRVQKGIAIRSRVLRLSLDNKWLTRDPTYRIRHQLKRGSNGAVVASGTTWSGSNDPISEPIDLWDDAFVQETSYLAELVVERPPGTVVAQHSQSVAVADAFDRSRPYVRWQKKHYYTPTAQGRGPQPVLIESAIHKTAIRERCKFCDVREGRFGTPYAMQYIDELPAPVEDGLSERLCGYCFPPGG